MDGLSVVEVTVDGGSTLLVPVTSVDGSVVSSDPAQQTGLTRLDVKDLLEPVQKFGESVRDQLSDLKPSKVTFECGVGAAVKAGKVVALMVDGSVDVSMKLTLEWDLSDGRAESSDSDKKV